MDFIPKLIRQVQNHMLIFLQREIKFILEVKQQNFIWRECMHLEKF